MSTPKLNAEERRALGRKVRKRMAEAGETAETLMVKIQKSTGHCPKYSDIMALYQGTAGLASLPWSLALYKLGYVTDDDLKPRKVSPTKPGAKAAKEKTVAKDKSPSRPRVRPKQKSDGAGSSA